MKISNIFCRLCLVACICIGGTAVAEDRHDALVLGDSLAFGFIANLGAYYFYILPENFVGFADDLGDTLHLDVVNASCPGESTGSFLSSTAQDNGCRFYREFFPLHADYSSTQLEFADKYLRSHHGVRLVTVTLGGNDLLLLLQACGSDVTCIQQGAAGMVNTVATNMATTLADLRATGYRGPIIVTNYESGDYSNVGLTALVSALNQAIAYPAAAYGAVVADVFTAFQKAVDANPFAAGNTCYAGLLNPGVDVSNPLSCDVHPTQVGHRLIARTVAKVYGRWDR
jgi:lysophospholipase L1-like esterase